MMWKKVLILFFVASTALVHVSWASPTELPSSQNDEEVMESTTTLPSSGESDDVVVVETTADEEEAAGDEVGLLGEMESGTESDEARELDPNDCFLEKSRGPCRAVIDSWFFNVATKTCESFMWSGCGGNNNRFRDKIQCEKHCINGITQEPASSLSSSTSTSSSTTASNNQTDAMILNAPSSSTSAEQEAAAMPTTMSSGTTATESSSTSTTTTTETATTTVATTTATTTLAPPKKKIGCPKFEGCAAKCIVVQEQSSGGCKKCQCPLPDQSATSSVKITRSVSQAEILAAAASSAAAKSPSVGSVSGLPVHVAEAKEDEESSDEDTTERPEEICKLPATRGHCRAMMTRYRYDPKVKDCVQFHFGGCEGNANNFVSKEKCLEFCKGQ